MKLTNEQQELLNRLCDAITKEFNILEMATLSEELSDIDQEDIVEYCFNRVKLIYAENPGFQS